ncbi:MAG: FtsX-like permease family protein [Clostridiales bacterium]|nr:FtsX-like permease family protein [Clostridiales bacterium]
MLVVMQMRSRKKEMAVIRSLGAGRLRVMAQSILEYALICLPVTLFALLIWRELSPLTVFGVWLAFMAGALCTIVRFSTIPLVKQIRELEE